MYLLVRQCILICCTPVPNILDLAEMWLKKGKYVSSVITADRACPCIAEQRKDEHHQFVVVKSLLQVAMKNTRDSPGHATTRASDAEYRMN